MERRSTLWECQRIAAHTEKATKGLNVEKANEDWSEAIFLGCYYYMLVRRSSFKGYE